MKVTCDKCGKLFNREPSKVKSKNFCSRECSKGPRNHITRPCEECGTLISRCKSHMRGRTLCKGECTSKYLSKKMSKLNQDLNPDRMNNVDTRAKIRQARLGRGDGRTYEKTYGRHTHRIIAEEKIGRPLLPGEVVHHIDENHRNNDPENLMVFSSQAEHAAFHQKLEKWKNS